MEDVVEEVSHLLRETFESDSQDSLPAHALWLQVGTGQEQAL